MKDECPLSPHLTARYGLHPLSTFRKCIHVRLHRFTRYGEPPGNLFVGDGNRFNLRVSVSHAQRLCNRDRALLRFSLMTRSPNANHHALAIHIGSKFCVHFTRRVLRPFGTGNRPAADRKAFFVIAASGSSKSPCMRPWRELHARQPIKSRRARPVHSLPQAHSP